MYMTQGGGWFPRRREMVNGLKARTWNVKKYNNTACDVLLVQGTFSVDLKKRIYGSYQNSKQGLNRSVCDKKMKQDGKNDVICLRCDEKGRIFKIRGEKRKREFLPRFIIHIAWYLSIDESMATEINQSKR
ncbi:hypothetical protein P5673_003562 [Acropora cervicornis]|uniref:Uncharacterized protein n=1 Tax=Acropora cervicornis TaxID=6130 RepID=A0AAD9VDY1_ACRCE|nr:hypothetical protein P5673_003562 [Acropora cervicornis]